jgi:hypothetical protein
VVVWQAGDWLKVVSPRRACYLRRRWSDARQRRPQMQQGLAVFPLRRATVFSNVPRTLVKERLSVLSSMARFLASHTYFAAIKV